MFGKEKKAAKTYEHIYFEAYVTAQMEADEGIIQKSELKDRIDHHICVMLSLNMETSIW